MQQPIKTLKQWIKEARCIVFFGGAGVSTESGIPDFRSVDGLYSQQYDYPPETIISRSFWARFPEEFYRFYRQKMLPLEAAPNEAHKALARLEQQGKLLAVVTQNIDGLHQKAGSNNVIELHGSIWRNRCVRCGKAFDAAVVRDAADLPLCNCGGLIKPQVVLYEEPLDESCVQNAVDAISRADLLIVGGTSLTVYPAAGLLQYFTGAHLVLINRDETRYDSRADLVLRDPIAQVFANL